MRRAAIAALVHRLNGGLNNAALAFELALARGDDADAESRQLFARGLIGVGQASRAVTLLELMLDPAMAPLATTPGPYAQDVADILRAHARRSGSGLPADIDLSALGGADVTPAATAEALLAGLATLERSK